MELRTLRYFIAVAREQNMTSAAAVMHVSQPALSYQIAELEKETACRLFERKGKKMILTESGLRLLDRAEQLLALADRIPGELRDAEEEVSGDVYIGAAETPRMHIIAEVIASLRKKHPDIRYHFYSGILDDVYERLRTGILDFAVMVEPFSFENCETIVLPETDRAGFLIRKDHPLAAGGSLAPEDLAGLPILVSSRVSAEQTARQYHLRPRQLNIIGTGNLTYNMAIMAEHGICAVSTLEGLVSCGEDSPLTFLPFEPPVEKHLVFAWKKYRPLSPAASALLAAMEEHLDTRGRQDSQ